MSNPTPSNNAQLEELLQNLRSELATQRQEITRLGSLHDHTTAALAASQQEVAALKQGSASYGDPKPQKPPTFSGKTSVSSWTMHMDNYLGTQDDNRALQIAITFLTVDAHEWWIGHCASTTNPATTWSKLRTAITFRYIPLNKVKQARDRLSRWKQLKSVPEFNTEFQKIILDIPNITVEEQIDRYSRALKPHIWRELCTTEYTDLKSLMKHAELVESAHTGSTRKKHQGSSQKQKPSPSVSNPTPMDVGNIRLEKLSQQEREKCMREGRCLRCRQTGHFARDCPKNH